MGAAVEEPDAQALALDAAERRARHAAVEGPGGEGDARRDLELAVDGGDHPFADRPPVRADADLAIVEVGDHLRRIEAVPLMVDRADHAVLAMQLDRLGARRRAMPAMLLRRRRPRPGKANAERCRRPEGRTSGHGSSNPIGHGATGSCECE